MKIGQINSYNLNCRKPLKYNNNIAFSTNKINKSREQKSVIKKLFPFLKSKEDTFEDTVEIAKKEAQQALDKIKKIKEQNTKEIIRLSHYVYYTLTESAKNKLNNTIAQANEQHDKITNELSQIQNKACDKLNEAIELINKKDNLDENYEYDKQAQIISQYDNNSKLLKRIYFDRNVITIEEFGFDKSNGYEFEDGKLTCFEEGIKQYDIENESIEKAFYIQNDSFEYYEGLNNKFDGTIKADKYIQSKDNKLTKYQINKIKNNNDETSEIALFVNSNSISLYKNMYIEKNEVKKADELIDSYNGNLVQYKQEWTKFDNENLAEIALNYIIFDNNSKPILYKQSYIANADGTNRANINMDFCADGKVKRCSFDYAEDEHYSKSAKADYRFINGNLYNWENNVSICEDGTIISDSGIVFDENKQPLIYYTDYLKKPDESQFAKKSITFQDGKLHSYQKDVTIDSLNNSYAEIEIFFDKTGNVINTKG